MATVAEFLPNSTVLRILQDTDGVDLIILCYRKPCVENGSKRITYLYGPDTTWTTSRNILLAEAMRHGSYLYYIFFDGDVELIRTPGKSGKGIQQFGFTKVLVNDNLYRMFENYLLYFKPAVAAPFFHWYFPRLPDSTDVPDASNHNGTSYPPKRDDEICAQFQFDALFNGFRYDALSFLLPYADINDRNSWWDSQYFVYSTAKIFYNSALMQVRPITSLNPEHGKYPSKYSAGKHVAPLFSIASGMLRDFFKLQVDLDFYLGGRTIYTLDRLDDDKSYFGVRTYKVPINEIRARINIFSGLWKNMCDNRKIILNQILTGPGRRGGGGTGIAKNFLSPAIRYWYDVVKDLC
jgi:hypothetical protein